MNLNPLIIPLSLEIIFFMDPSEDPMLDLYLFIAMSTLASTGTNFKKEDHTFGLVAPSGLQYSERLFVREQNGKFPPQDF